MPKTQRRRCPVCWTLVARTMHGMIEGHWDSLGTMICPATSEPYIITVATKRHTRSDAQAVAA